MTLVPSEPTPLTDEALKGIGAVVVEASRLEWTAAGLWVVLAGGGSESQRLSGRTSQTLTECRRLVRDFPSDLRDAVEHWVDHARELLRHRDRLVHSSWFGGEEGVVTRHLRSGDGGMLDPARTALLARDLGLHSAAGFALCLKVDFSITPEDRQRLAPGR